MSNALRLLPSQTAAITTPRRFDACYLSSLAVAAFGLAGAETVGVKVLDEVNSTWGDVYEDGAVLQLTATKPQVVLAGGPVYGFTKSATAAAVYLQGHPVRL